MIKLTDLGHLPPIEITNIIINFNHLYMIILGMILVEICRIVSWIFFSKRINRVFTLHL